MKSSKIISVKNLKIFAKQTALVKGVSFEINENSILGIIGESGSGKSLTALSILNLIKYKGLTQTGKIFFKNELISKNNIEDIIKNKISIIFQDPMSFLNPSMRCGNQINEALKVRDKQSVLDLIEKVKIPNPVETYNKYPHELSGGQQQRIMIAIAIAKNPDLIIADEATSSLDSLVKKDILKLLIELKKEFKTSLVIVSHNLNLIYSISNYVLVMNKGMIVEKGTTKQLFKKPKEEYTKNLIKENKIVDKKSGKQSKANTILVVKNLDLSLGNKIILDNINFKIKKGETLGLIGQSGSGKTTISRCLTGFYKNYNGEIKYDEINIREISRYKLSRKIQLIFQDPYSALNPNIKIVNQIIDPIMIHFKMNKNEAKTLAIEYLNKVELKKHLFNKYPSELSGGERQRVVIARALSLKPELIICDECVSALDKSIQNAILKLLNKLKIELKLTYIFISHDLSLVKHMSDNIIVLKNGIIVDQNSTKAIFKKPKDYTKKLIEAII